MSAGPDEVVDYDELEAQQQDEAERRGDELRDEGAFEW